MPHNLVFNDVCNSHVFILISENSFSVAAVEAMSRGLPIVVSKSNSIHELITEGIQGFVIKNDKRMNLEYITTVLKSFISELHIIHKMLDAILKTLKSVMWRENVINIFQILVDNWGAKF